MLKITLLNQFSVFWGEKQIDGFSSRTAGATFAYLAMHPHQPQARGMLTDLLYSNLPERQARQNFRKMVSRLRNAFAGEGLPACEQILDIQDDYIAFAPQVAYEVDVLKFESLWQMAQTADMAQVERSRHVAQLLRQAVRWYTGNFLPTAMSDTPQFGAWAFMIDERLSQLALTAWHRLAQHAHTIGAFEQMLLYGQKQIEHRLWGEEGYYQTMIALAALGQRSAALAQYKQCCQALEQHLNTTPSAKLVHLYQQLQTASTQFTLFRRSAELPPHNLPSTITPLIGRQQELEQVLDLLGDPLVRLVTIIGEGGVGKTRLAKATAVRLAGLARFLPETPFPDGVWWVSLAEMINPHTLEEGLNMLATQLLDTLGASWQPSRPPTAVLTNYLRERQILLVLDYYEHIANTAHLLSQLLQTCPQLNLLVTSRTALHLQSENLFALSGLYIAAEPPLFVDEGEAKQPYDAALALFAAVGTRVTGRAWYFTAQTLPLVHHFCQLVRGNPLAIELAASWVRYLPLTGIITELEQNLGLLATHHFDLPERHRSIQAVFLYSWELLNPTEQAMLQVVSIMQTPCSLVAIHAIHAQLSPDQPPPLWATRQTLLTLIDHSLVRLDEERTGYDMHPLLRQFGQTQAQANDSGWALPPTVGDGLAYLQGFHADYFLGLVAEKQVVLFGAEPYHRAVPELTAVWEDIRQAWTTAVNQANPTILQPALPALLRYIRLRALYFEGESLWRELVDGLAHWPTAVRHTAEILHDRAWAGLALIITQITADKSAEELIGRVCQQVQDGEALCQAHLAQHDLFMEQGRLTEAYTALQTAAHWAEITGDPRLQIHILFRQQPHLTNSLAQVEEALVWAQALPDNYLSLIVTTRLGGAAFFMGRQNRAREAWEQSLAIAQLQRNKVRESILLNNLGDIYRFFGEYARAQQAQERSLQLARQMGDQIMQINVLEGLTRTYTSLKMYAQGEVAIQNCLSLAHTLHKWATLVFALNAQGHLYRAQKKFIQAEESYRQAIAFVSTKPDLAHVLLETYAGLAEIAMAQGRVGEAFTAVAQFRELEARTPLEHYLDVTWLFAVVANVLQAQGEEALSEQYRQEVRLYVTRHLQALAMEPERQAAYRARVAGYLSM